MHHFSYCAWAVAFLLFHSASCTIFGPNISQYEVHVLPDVNFPISRSWAGAVSIPTKADDKLFFWLFEAENNTHSNDLIIWLNGGPGCSSLAGLTQEIGPLSFAGNATLPHMNQYSWTKLANVLFVDQPVGTGFSGGGDAANTNAEVTEDFYLWLVNFFSLFPGLKSKRIHLMGESYAGIYIPYFADFILKNSRNSTINLKSISLGDGTIGNVAAITDVVVNKFMHEQNHFLKVPNEILNEFDRADKLCGFDTVLAQLQYPPAGKIIIPGNPEGENFRKRQLVNSSICEGYIPPLTPELVRQEIDAKCYDGSTGCATFTTATDYLRATRPCWNIYNVATDCSNGLDQVSGANWLNKPSVKSAIQAPLNKTFEYCNATVQSKLAFELVRPPVYDILPSLLSLMPVHIYSGQYDLILNHIGTELAIQNMTWRGHQGFKRAPLTPFYANGIRAGTWGRERGLSYHLFERSGHMVPRDAPASAFVFVRDFVLKSTGLQGVN